MAVDNICDKISQGQDLACTTPVKRYHQQIVLGNLSDVDQEEVVAPWKEDYPIGECGYVQFQLKPGATGYRFNFPLKGSSVSGTYDFSTSDTGFNLFMHHINMLVATGTEESKCLVEKLFKGQVFGALQTMDGGVEIYGLQNGLFVDDVTIDIQTNGGATPIVLSSREGMEESFPPLQYRPQQGGDAGADFDALFANTGS